MFHGKAKRTQQGNLFNTVIKIITIFILLISIPTITFFIRFRKAEEGIIMIIMIKTVIIIITIFIILLLIIIRTCSSGSVRPRRES